MNKKVGMTSYEFNWYVENSIVPLFPDLAATMSSATTWRGLRWHVLMQAWQLCWASQHSDSLSMAESVFCQELHAAMHLTMRLSSVMLNLKSWRQVGVVLFTKKCLENPKVRHPLTLVILHTGGVCVNSASSKRGSLGYPSLSRLTSFPPPPRLLLTRIKDYIKGTHKV